MGVCKGQIIVSTLNITYKTQLNLCDQHKNNVVVFDKEPLSVDVT